MLKKITIVAILSLSLLFASAQSSINISKECRISTGTGIAGTTNNLEKMGQALWLQLDNKVHNNFSVALDFENMNYKQPGYYTTRDFTFSPNVIHVVNNNFSLLVKYHIATKQKLKFAIASGWAYCIKQEHYYSSVVLYNPSYVTYVANVAVTDDYKIPFLLETSYPILKTLAINARAKYNYNTKGRNTYSVGLGLSLKL